MNDNNKINIALFSSGSGSNAQKIIEYFLDHKLIKVEGVFCNNPKALVLERAGRFNVPTVLFTREEFYKSDSVVKKLQEMKVQFIVLAGFLWLVPSNLVSAYKGKIINIHPALLPKFGGKGMYGMNVHKAVVEKGEPESGISIHYVNELYDEGDIIFQAKCIVDKNDTPEEVQHKVQKLEHEHFPMVIEKVILDLKDQIQNLS